jgi:hypothetical protein
MAVIHSFHHVVSTPHPYCIADANFGLRSTSEIFSCRKYLLLSDLQDAAPSNLVFQEQLQSHEDQIRAELSEEKTALQKTIQTLETEVVSQKARATIAEGRLRAEHKKIQVAEAYGEEWKGKHEIQEEATAEWKKTAIENEKSSKDWEAKYQGLRKKLRGLM